MSIAGRNHEKNQVSSSFSFKRATFVFLTYKLATSIPWIRTANIRFFLALISSQDFSSVPSAILIRPEQGEEAEPDSSNLHCESAR